ncbi:hypothetical protein DNTS_016184 [Danionella cerebrum]|uniref:Uncharacterized protein n=1 Tax=Danionella cerebrum TaxID=2873325 RepID=A0A553Q505_9TELE|nr:hypothetical protein DNTS_016184 [Danionella translucida]
MGVRISLELRGGGGSKIFGSGSRALHRFRSVCFPGGEEMKAGLLVAVLYCFANGEVRLRLKRGSPSWIFLRRNGSHRSLFCSLSASAFPDPDAVQQELRKRWQVFCESHRCFSEIHPKHLCRCSERNQCSTTNQEPRLTPRLAAAYQAAEPELGGRSQAPESCLRKSLSSSEGDFTLGETMEEVMEESEL